LVFVSVEGFRASTRDNRDHNPAETAKPSYPPSFVLDVDSEQQRYHNEVGTAKPVLARKNLENLSILGFGYQLYLINNS